MLSIKYCKIISRLVIHYKRLTVAVHNLACSFRLILPITEPSDKLFALRDFVNLFVDIIVNTAYNGANARLL